MSRDDAPVQLLERPTETERSEAPPVATPSVEAAAAPERPIQDVPIGPDAPVMEILRTTRAMRYLAPDPVPDELIRSVIEAATWAANGRNAQLTQYLVVTDRSTMARLAPLWAAVIDDYRTLMRCADLADGPDAVSQRIVSGIDHLRDHFAEVPALIVVCEDVGAERRATKSPSAVLRTTLAAVGIRRTIRLFRAWGRFASLSQAASCYPAVENLLIAARRTDWPPVSRPGTCSGRPSSSRSSGCRRTSRPGRSSRSAGRSGSSAGSTAGPWTRSSTAVAGNRRPTGARPRGPGAGAPGSPPMDHHDHVRLLRDTRKLTSVPSRFLDSIYSAVSLR